MTRAVFGRTEADVERKLDGVPRDELEPAVIAGTPGEIVERLGRLSEAGVQRVMLQWLEVDDLDGLEAMAALGAAATSGIDGAGSTIPLTRR